MTTEQVMTMRKRSEQEDKGAGVADSGKTRAERGRELQALMRTSEGKDIISSCFLKHTGMPEGQLPPVSLLMIQTILDHEYPSARSW
jgi:hypothetical protein